MFHSIKKQISIISKIMGYGPKPFKMNAHIIAKPFYKRMVEKLIKHYSLSDVVYVSVTVVPNLKSSRGYRVDALVSRLDTGMYSIQIHEKSKSNKSICLAHEMVHVKQYEKSELVYKDGDLYWKGVLVDTDKVSYRNLPWEQDAFLNEGHLARRYGRSRKV